MMREVEFQKRITWIIMGVKKYEEINMYEQKPTWYNLFKKILENKKKQITM